MTATTGPNAGFTYGWASGDTWDMNVNWTMLDGQFMLALISMALIAPPASPAAGDRYWIASGSTPTGAWASHAGTVARWNGTAWEFVTPKEGWLARLRADSRVYHYDGSGNWLSTTPYASNQGTLATYSGTTYGIRQLDFQKGLQATDSGTGYIQISLTGQFSVSLATTVQGSAYWPFDFSGGAQTIANGSYTSIAVGSGLLILNNTTNGDVGIYAVGGGNVVLIASTGGTFVATASAPAGKIGVYWSSPNYTIYSNYGSSISLAIGGIRSRAAG